MEDDKKRQKIIKKRAFVISICKQMGVILILCFLLWNKVAVKEAVIIVLLISLLIWSKYIISFIAKRVRDSEIVAVYHQYSIGLMRGMWQQNGLIRQIQRCFFNSDDIKVKVTRGFDLLNKENEFGFVKILDALVNEEGKKSNQPKTIKFLLSIPCYQEEHFRERYLEHRYSINPDKLITQEDFAESCYKFLQKIQKYNSVYLKIQVRFYFDNHEKWRFYIFSKNNIEKTTVMLSNYDKEKSGSSTPMYKIIKSESNIGGFMTDYFEEIWESAITPQQLYKIINGKRGSEHRLMCDMCKNEAFERYKNWSTPEEEYKTICQGFARKYEKELNSFCD